MPCLTRRLAAALTFVLAIPRIAAAQLLFVSNEGSRNVSVGTDPEQFGVTPDGARLYASNEDAGTASATDLRAGRVLATLVVGIEPEGVAISLDGRWVYVTAETSNTVSVIDTRTNRVAASFLVDVRPRAVAFRATGGAPT